MKCIKKNGVVKRVRDRVAEVEVEREGWEYCPKSEHKAFRREHLFGPGSGRVINKPEDVPEISSDWLEVALSSVGVKRE